MNKPKIKLKSSGGCKDLVLIVGGVVIGANQMKSLEVIAPKINTDRFSVKVELVNVEIDLEINSDKFTVKTIDRWDAVHYPRSTNDIMDILYG